MKAVDTNVLLRFVVRDDPQQFDAAAEFLRTRTARDPAFISLFVVAELIWALDRRYNYPRESIWAVLSALLESAEVVFEEEHFLSTLVAERTKGDISDHLIAYCARRTGCSAVVTFDRDAALLVPAMELLP